MLRFRMNKTDNEFFPPHHEEQNGFDQKRRLFVFKIGVDLAC